MKLLKGGKEKWGEMELGDFVLCSAVVIPTPTSSMGDPFSSEFLLGLLGDKIVVFLVVLLPIVGLII